MIYFSSCRKSSYKFPQLKIFVEPLFGQTRFSDIYTYSPLHKTGNICLGSSHLQSSMGLAEANLRIQFLRLQVFQPNLFLSTGSNSLLNHLQANICLRICFLKNVVSDSNQILLTICQFVTSSTVLNMF